MSKSILIIDTPKNCEDCPLFRTDEDFNATIHYCMPYQGKELFMVKEKGVSENCPLKPTPEKRKYLDYDLYAGSGFDRGYNACIDELLGEEDDR